MSTATINDKEKNVMRLVHYFITHENYIPVSVHGVQNEIWLENLDASYKIIRINSGYIHNYEQLEHDYLKTKHILKFIRKKTLSIKFRALNINLDVRGDMEKIVDKDIDLINVKNIKDLNYSDVIKNNYPDILKNLLPEVNKLDFFYQATKDIEEKTKEDNKAYEDIFKPKPIIVTYILMGISILLFSLMYIFGNGSEDMLTLLKFGANYAPLVKAGEIWRLLASTFLHIGIFHLAVNMWALYLLGSQVETFVGKARFLSIYLVSGIMGSLFSVLLNDVVSAGASGAIFGLMGSLLYFGTHFRIYLNTALRTQILPIIFLNFVIGFIIPGIDIAAHAGGIIGGYLITSALSIKVKRNKKEELNSILALLILFIFLIYLIFFR